MGTEFQDDRIIMNGERERRTKRLFQIEQDVRYKMLYGQRLAETGSGKTMNISSGGIWYTTEALLTSGMPIELSVTWPVLLNDSCPMKLMVYGCVARNSERGAVMAIERYEFRTSGRSLQAQPINASVHAVELRAQSRHKPRAGSLALQLLDSGLEDVMLWTIFVILLVLWLLGLVTSYTMGGFIHILLIVAIAVLCIQLITGRRAV